MSNEPTLSPFRASCLTFAAAAAVVLACAVDKPQSPDRSRQAITSQENAVESAQSLGANTFFEFQVAKPASLRETPHLKYPASLRGSGVSGEVVAQYVVDQTGRVDVSSFKVLNSSRPEFIAVVKEALPTLQFDAAVIRGKRVKQLVQQAFRFTAPPGA